MFRSPDFAKSAVRTLPDGTLVFLEEFGRSVEASGHFLESESFGSRRIVVVGRITRAKV